LPAHGDRRAELVEVGGVAVKICDVGTVRQLVPDVAAFDHFAVHLADDVDPAVVRDAVHNGEI